MGMLDELDLRIDLSEVREAAARYGLQHQLAGQQDENSAKSDSSADEVLPFTVQQLRATYRSKMLAHHPDKGGDPELFLEAHSDYSLLLEWWNLWMRKSGRNCSSRSAPPPPGTTASASASAAANETPTTFAENDFNVYIPPRGPGSGGGGGASSATSKLGGGAGNPNPVGRAGAPTSRTSAFVLNPHPGNRNLHANSATSSTTPAPSRGPAADVPGNAAASPASSAASGSEEEDVEDLFRPVITELLKTRILGSNKAAKFAKHLAPAAEVGEVEVGRAAPARDADEVDSVAAEEPEPFDGVGEVDTSELLAVRSTRRQTEAAGGDQQCDDHGVDEQNSPSSGSSSSGTTSEDSTSPNSESRTGSEAETTSPTTAGAGANREASAAPKDSIPSPAPGVDQSSSSRDEECDGNGNERESEGAEPCSSLLSSDERRGREASGSASTSPSKNLYRRGISAIVESIHKNRVRNLQQLGPSHTKALMSGRVQALLGRPPGAHARALQPLV